MSSLGPTFGAMFVGLLIAMFLQGVLSVQTYAYYVAFPNDKRILKLLVAAVWLIDLVHLILISHATYHYLIVNWGNETALSFPTTSFDLQCAFVGLATLLCQTFFLRRIWALSKSNKILVGVLGVGCLANLALEMTMVTRLFQTPNFASYGRIAPEIISLCVVSVVVDISIGAVLCMYLNQGLGDFEHTNSIISRIVQYTVATSLITTTFSIGSLVAYLARPHLFIFIAMHFSGGRLYTNSLLASLNSRSIFRTNLNESMRFTGENAHPNRDGFVDSRTHNESFVESGNSRDLKYQRVYQGPVLLITKQVNPTHHMEHA